MLHENPILSWNVRMAFLARLCPRSHNNLGLELGQVRHYQNLLVASQVFRGVHGWAYSRERPPVWTWAVTREPQAYTNANGTVFSLGRCWQVVVASFWRRCPNTIERSRKAVNHQQVDLRKAWHHAGQDWDRFGVVQPAASFEGHFSLSVCAGHSLQGVAILCVCMWRCLQLRRTSKAHVPPQKKVSTREQTDWHTCNFRAFRLKLQPSHLQNSFEKSALLMLCMITLLFWPKSHADRMYSTCTPAQMLLTHNTQRAGQQLFRMWCP